MEREVSCQFNKNPRMREKRTGEELSIWRNKDQEFPSLSGIWMTSVWKDSEFAKQVI